MKDRKIIIVGAGLAGLSAGRALEDAGRPFVILEARKRIGGRTVTRELSGGKIDHGAAWIHGNEGNPIAAACDAYGIRYDPHNTHDVATVYDSLDGRRQTGEEVKDGLERLPELIAIAEPEDSAEQAIARYLEKAGLSGSRARKLQFLFETLASATSAPMERLALYYPLNLLTTRQMEGGDHVIAGGYSRLIEKLAENLDVRLGAPVERVEYSDKGVRVTTSEESLEGSHAIVTVPLGVLKAGAMEFDPPLPQPKAEAISKLEMGSFEKVALTFRERFWEGFSDLAEFNSNVALRNAGSGAKRSFPVFFDVTNFAGTVMVVCLYSGAFARRAQSELTDEELVDGAREALGEILGQEVPPHVDAAVTRWHSDPFSRGSYSYFPAGSGPEDMDALAKPVLGRLLFAGEHTISQYNATAHGAMLSGLREAQRIEPKAVLPGWS